VGAEALFRLKTNGIVRVRATKTVVATAAAMTARETKNVRRSRLRRRLARDREVPDSGT